jgi:TRAP-type C4-dicarboxylate transport system permease small subunit
VTRESDKSPVATANRWLNGTLAGLASLSLLAMMVLIVGNMLRRVVAAPFPGAFEVVGWLAAITAALALGYTQLHKGHVDIDIVTRLLPFRVQSALRLFVSLMSAGFFVLLAWRLSTMAGRLQAVGTLSESLRVPYHPFVYVVAVGMLGLAAALCADVFHSARAVWKGGPRLVETIATDAGNAKTDEDGNPGPAAGHGADGDR